MQDRPARHPDRHRLIRMVEVDTGRAHVTELTRADAAGLYSPADLARLDQGMTLLRDGVRHTDLCAFHDRMTDPTRAHVVSLDQVRARLLARRAHRDPKAPLDLAPYAVVEGA